MASLKQALGFVTPDESWMAEGRCVYGNTDTFLGKTVIRDGEYVLSEAEHQKLVDKHFLNDHDSRWSSGDESKGLPKAVKECLDCPVRQECLRYSVKPEMGIQYGIYGGTTSWERRVVFSETFLSDVSIEARISILEHMVLSKELGWADESIPIDKVKDKENK